MVVDAARTLLRIHGADDLSLRAVARHLGVSAPALYWYVESKDELLGAVATEQFEALVHRFDEIDATLPPIQRMRRLSRAYVEHALDDPALFRLMFRYPFRPTASVDAFPPAARAFDHAARAAEEAIAAGDLTGDASQVNLAMWAAVHGVAEVLL